MRVLFKKRKSGFFTSFFLISLTLALVALLFHLLSYAFPSFADLVSQKISHSLRSTLAYLTALFPFSLAEWMLLFIPVWLFLLLRRAYRLRGDRRATLRMLSAVLAVPLLLYSAFVFTLGTGYYATPLADKMALPQYANEAQGLYQLTCLLSERAEEEGKAAGVQVLKEGSRSPLTHQEVNLILLDAYDTLSEEYGFIQSFQVGTKEVTFSRPMAYTHITGVYTFFTGESNVCTAYPDYSVIFTAAHEMAHARGIAREDEANFVAFLVCERASHPYVRYAGYMSLLQYVSNALYEADRTAFREAWQQYSDRVVDELLAYNAVLATYSESVVSDVAGSINNAYLEGMGTGGSVSYSMVVSLALRYFPIQR